MISPSLFGGLLLSALFIFLCFNSCFLFFLSFFSFFLYLFSSSLLTGKELEEGICSIIIICSIITKSRLPPRRLHLKSGLGFHPGVYFYRWSFRRQEHLQKWINRKSAEIAVLIILYLQHPEAISHSS